MADYEYDPRDRGDVGIPPQAHGEIGAQPNQWGTTKGYGVTHPPIDPRKHHNAFLSNQAFDGTEGEATIPMWVTGLSADFGVSGATAQSALQRSWYPRHFNQPSFAIEGICANQKQIDTMMEFIRGTHLRSVRMASDNLLTGFTLLSGNEPHIHKGAIRGPNSGIRVKGWVRSAQRRAAKDTVGPTYALEFIVVSAEDGSVFASAQTIATQRQLRDWTRIVMKNPDGSTKGIDGPGWVTNPDGPGEQPPEKPVFKRVPDEDGSIGNINEFSNEIAKNGFSF